MNKRVLEIEFLDSENRKFRIKVDDAKEDINRLSVKSLSDFIIADKVFSGPAGELVSMKDAFVRNTEIEKIL